MVVRLLFPFRIRLGFCDGRKKEGSREKPSKKTNSELDPGDSRSAREQPTTALSVFPRSSLASSPGLHWLCFASLCDWFRKLAPLSTNRMVKWNQSRLGRPRFPRFGQFACSYSEFSLALNEFSFFLIGCWDYLGFGFTTVNRKLL